MSEIVFHEAAYSIGGVRGFAPGCAVIDEFWLLRVLPRLVRVACEPAADVNATPSIMRSGPNRLSISCSMASRLVASVSVNVRDCGTM